MPIPGGSVWDANPREARCLHRTSEGLQPPGGAGKLASSARGRLAGYPVALVYVGA